MTQNEGAQLRVQGHVDDRARSQGLRDAYCFL